MNCVQRYGTQLAGNRVAIWLLFAFAILAVPPRSFADPTITLQPQKRTVVEGTNYTFTVTASGTMPLSYQWRLNGSELAGQTNFTLPLTNIQTTNAGNYQVVVTNIAGAVTSVVATLTVRGTNDPVYATPQGGWTYIYAGSAAASPEFAALDGTWNHDNGTDSWSGDGRGPGNGLAGGVGTTNGLLTVEDVITSASPDTDNRRFYFTHSLSQEAAVTNANTLLNDGVTLSFRARLTPAPPADPLTELTNAPNGFVNLSAGKGMFGIRQSGSSGMIISFSLNNAVEDTSTNATFNFGQAGLHMNTLNGNSGSAVDPGFGTLNLFPVDPTVFHEFWITIEDNGAAPGTHRISIYVDGNQTRTVFNVTAGTGNDGATNYLALGPGSTFQRGGYDLDFFAYKPGLITPYGFNDPVSIVMQPTNQFVVAGQMASFNVGVAGTPPYSFQWYKNGTPISNATNSSYITPPLSAADDGAQFTVVVTNSSNSITSSPPAILSLLPPPVITSQPQSLMVTNGDPASFSVAATSHVAIAYQWRFNGVNVSNATNAMFTISNTRPSSGGGYDVVVSNISGSATSLVATLVIKVLDYGDAPDPAYPTLLVNNGARHVIVAGFHLGTNIDLELNGHQNASATGDDTTDSDDEDGVRFSSPLLVGQLATVEIVASTNGLLDAWIDFNGEGSWATAGDQIFTNQTLLPGTNALTFLVPATASPVSTFTRFRFSSAGSLSFSGPAADGEVEDHAVTTTPVADLAVTMTDAPNPVAVNGNLTYTLIVTNSGPSDANGVVLSNTLPSSVSFVSASSSQGSCIQDGGTVTCSLSNLNNGTTAIITIEVLPTATGMITNLASVSGHQIDLLLSNNISATATRVLGIDFGDAPGSAYPTLLASDGSRHLIVPGFHLGAGADAEPDGLPNAMAAGDDANGIDDEDGVTFTSPLLVGRTATLAVVASTNGFLDAWIDFNTNGTWLEPEERVFAFQPLAPGTNLLTLVVPATAHLSSTFARFRFSSSGGLSYDGLASDGEVEDYQVTILPAIDLAVTQADFPDPVSLGSNLTYTITITNGGASTATGVMLTDPLLNNASLVSALASQGTCNNQNGTILCDLGSVPSGGSATVMLVVTPTRLGALTNTSSVAANEFDYDLGNNQASQVSSVVVISDPFANAGVINIDQIGAATPYPSSIFVSGLTATVYKVTVTLSNVSHVFPADLDVLLVGPQGQSVLLMSDAGAGHSISGQTLSFDDDAPSPLSDSIQISTGTFKPTNYEFLGDTFPVPAPAGPFGANLSVFAGTDPNGTWSLYVVDDADEDTGLINDGWSLTIATLNPIADLALAVLDLPDPVAVGSNLTYMVTLTNRGPAAAMDVTLVNQLPGNASFISATTSQGICTNKDGILYCALGSMGSGTEAVVTLVVIPTAVGAITNVASVAGHELDLNVSNNAAQAVSTVTRVTDLSVTMSGSPDTVLLGQNVTYNLTVTNHGPNMANGVILSDTLPNEGSLVSAMSSQGSCTNTGRVLTCDLGTLASGDAATVTITVTPQRIGSITNTAAVSAEEIDLNPANNAATHAAAVIIVAGPFESHEPIAVPEVGVAMPYPSTIHVSGLTGTLYKVTVTLSNLSHAFADDLDILLVGPRGQNVMLLSDAGGTFAATDVTLTFDDESALLLPDSSQIGPGTYKPTEFDSTSDAFAPPAPAGPYGSTLSIFNGTDPNGTWSLYVLDDEAPNSGLIGGGWSLTIAILEPIADLAIAKLESPDPVGLSSNLTYTITVTNHGPAGASGVTVLDSLSDSVSFLSATSSQGACTNESGVIRCDLGSLVTGTNAVVTIIVTPTLAGMITNVAAVMGDELDLELANNSSAVTTTAGDPPAIVVPPQSQTATTGDDVTFAVTVSGSAPFHYQWQRNGTNLNGATNGSLTLTGVAVDDGGGYRVSISNLVGTVLSDEAILTVLVRPTISDILDQQTNEDTVTAAIVFTIQDQETPAASLVLSAHSSNPILLPDANIGFGGAGNSRTVMLRPATNQFGMAMITVTVTDSDGIMASDSFVFTVLPSNDPPTLFQIARQTVNEDTPSGPIDLTVGDDETPAENLTVMVTSSNQELVPNGNLLLGGSGANRTLTVTPLSDQFGTTTISVTVMDGEAASVTSAFELVVLSVDDPPVIGPIANQTIDEDTATIPLAFTIADPDTPVANLTLSGLSSNPTLVANANIGFAGIGTNRTVTVRPGTNQSGTALITVRVNDGASSATSAFVLTVNAVNDSPVISDIVNQSMEEDTSLGVPFVVGDAETSADSLTVTASSSNPALIPTGNIVLGGSGPNRMATLTPISNQFGTAIITVTVNDGTAFTNDTFVLTVNPVNDPPTLAPNSNLTINEDAGLQTINLSGIGTGAANEVQAVTVTANSSNTGLVPNPIVNYTSPNATGTLTFTPVANATGVAIITVTVNDGQSQNNTTIRTFTVTVMGTNDLPTISTITNQSTIEDAPITVPFIVSDPETAAMGLVVTGSSTNTSLVANTNILINGSGTNRTVTIVPTANLFGTTRITLTVSDGALTASNSFVLTVNSANDPPTLDRLADGGVLMNKHLIRTLTGITSGAPNESQTLIVTAVAANTALIKEAKVTYSSPATNGTLDVDAQDHVSGVTTVTVTVNDGQATNNLFSRTFTVRVWNDDVNTGPPTISSITNQVTSEDIPTPSIAFTVGDSQTPANLLTVGGQSSNTNLVPDGNFVFGGSGSNRTVTVTPAPNKFGTAQLTLMVVDAAFGVTNRTFLLTVNPVNDAPTVSSIANQTINEDSSAAVIPFTVADVETPAAGLTVTATSSNSTLVPNGNIVLGGNGTNRALFMTPLANQSGSATITVTANDGLTNGSASFVLTVNSSNDLPTISSLADQAINEDSATAAMAVTVGDLETAAASLAMSGSSSNPSLVPDGNITFGGSGANRTATVTPASNQFGSANITVTVTDTNGGAANSSFLLTVNPVNDPPTLDTINNVTLNADAGPQIITLSGISFGPLNENQSLAVSATSSSPGLIPHPTVSYTSPNATGTVTFAPLASSNGTATITVTVNDGQAQNNLSSRSFTVAVNGVPTISDIADLTTAEDTVTGPVPFTVSDAETSPGNLIVTATSSNPNLVPDANIVLSGTGTNRTATILPATNQFGTATITIKVVDGNGSMASDTFVLTVVPINDPPVITSQPQSQSVTNGADVTFSVTATGDGPLSYQWQHNGTDLTGKTDVTLLVTSVQGADAGVYIVAVTNPQGTVFSAAANLRILAPPIITEISRTGASASVSFTTESGVTYTVEYKNAVTDPAWEFLSPVIGTGSVMTVIDAMAAMPARVYRVRAE